ncbi:cytochrome b-c1 complex subunit Rieske, mitochondrial-like [Crassostrea virginica]|mmetsp:Transcript_35902/g.57298  ORF Transcript_35902/g.57298 Transcript_35902/m.57298 type:complete len:263 (-) Transcript_35902:125-913(-)
MSFTGSFRVPLGSAVSRLSHTVTKSNAKEIATGAQGLRVPVIRRKSPELQSFNARIGAVSCLARRNYHTDIPPPDFSHYRSHTAKKANVPREEFDVSRKVFSYTIVGGVSAATLYLGKEIVQDLVGYLDINDAARALAITEIKLDEIPVGKSMLTTWKGMPLFVRHRTEAEIKTEQEVDLLSLRDPQHDSDRSLVPEWMILVGVCTHLGCIPLQDQGSFAGGMYCPCHGSHYDSSGRIRKGPAPLNLTVAPHKIKGDYLVVG